METSIITTFTEEMEAAATSYTEMQQPVKMLHTFHIGASRNVNVDEENHVTICDQETGKRAFFTAQRWVRFVQEIPQIDIAVQCAMTFKQTVLQLHIGGQWYVGVTDEVPIVDICRWFIRSLDNVLRPTPTGIAVTYSQWNTLKKVAEQMKTELPQFTAISPCWHDSQWELEYCHECNPTPRCLTM